MSWFYGYTIMKKNYEDERDGNVSKGEKVLDLTPIRQILFAVRENNEYRALQAVNEVIEKGMPGIMQNTITEWKFYLVRVLTLLINMFGGEPETSDFIDRLNVKVLLHIDACKSVEECQEFFVVMVRNFCRMNEEIGGQHSALVRSVMEQVSMDLTKPLTLHYFADMLNVNSSYLSNLFRKQTGMTLTEFVTDKRLAHAASLLVFTDMPIKQVARMAGIPDVQYFSRLFRRKMDMTPSQYRDSKRGRK